jgi:hypothetical protein
MDGICNHGNRYANLGKEVRRSTVEKKEDQRWGSEAHLTFRALTKRTKG